MSTRVHPILIDKPYFSLPLVHPAITQVHDLNDCSMMGGHFIPLQEESCEGKGQRMYST